MTNMVQNGLFPGVHDLFVNKQLDLVPDTYDVGREYYSYYWWVSLKLLNLGLNNTDGCDIRLSLRSINYSANVFQDGNEVPPETKIGGEAGAVGLFHWWTYIIISGMESSAPNQKRWLKRNENIIAIAVLVEPPDYPGRVTGDQGGDHDIAGNAAMQQYTEGWDCLHGTPDRNTGLWDHVSLQLTDPTVSI